MQTATAIGLDIAKSFFQLHGVGAEGNVILPGRLKRRCAGLFPEAAAVLDRYRSLRLIAGRANSNSEHSATHVGLMPPAYVKPYVKRHKNDANGAADRIAFATCEARR